MRLRRLAGAVFVLVAFGFLVAFVARDVERLRDFDWELRPGLLAASVALNVAGLCVGVAAWRVLLGRLGHPIRLRDLARIWFLSGLGRYIPGKIWQFVGAAHLGAGAGVPVALTVTTLAAHTFFFLVAAFGVAVYLVPGGAIPLPSPALTTVRAAAPLLLLLAHPAVIRRVLRLARRLSGREVGQWTGSWRAALAVIGLGVVAWTLTGIALHLFVRSLVPIPPGAVVDFIGIHALAFVAGYLVFVAPAGLGAKEGALAALLTAYLPISVAAIVAVAARLWTILAEVIPALLLLRRPGSPLPPDVPDSDPSTP